MKTVNLKEYIKTLESGKRPKGGAVSSGVPSLGAEHINSFGGFNLDSKKMKFVPIEYYDKLNKGLIRKDDILIVKDGATTGKVAYIDEKYTLEDSCINEHLFLVRTKEELIPKFLFYFLYSNLGKNEVLKDFRGATVGGISKEFVDIKLYIPSIKKQREIILVLDIVQELIYKRKVQIAELDALVKSQFVGWCVSIV